jgi:hypothetical protein
LIVSLLSVSSVLPHIDLLSATKLSTGQKIMQVLIVLFCLWHMSAVLIYCIPREATDRFAVGSRILLPFVTPYMLTTSQWQLWDLFAPDPLNGITRYRIDVYEKGEWRPLTTLQTGSFEWWRHANYFKLFVNVFGTSGAVVEPAKELLVTHFGCDAYHLAPGTIVHLVYEEAVIPRGLAPRSRAWWSNWKPNWVTTNGPTIKCTAS